MFSFNHSSNDKIERQDDLPILFLYFSYLDAFLKLIQTFCRHFFDFFSSFSRSFEDRLLKSFAPLSSKSISAFNFVLDFKMKLIGSSAYLMPIFNVDFWVLFFTSESILFSKVNSFSSLYLSNATVILPLSWRFVPSTFSWLSNLIFDSSYSVFLPNSYLSLYLLSFP